MKEPTEADLEEIEKLYQIHDELLKESMLRPFKRHPLTVSQQRIVKDLEFLLSHPRCSRDVELKLIDALAKAADEIITRDVPS